MKRKPTKAAQIFFKVIIVVCLAQWFMNMVGLFMWKDFPAWIFRPMAWVYWLVGCFVILGGILVALGVDDEHKR